MIVGSKDGTYQIDYLNDAMKEFGIRIKDNLTGTISALEEMGMNEQDIMNSLLKVEIQHKKTLQKLHLVLWL